MRPVLATWHGYRISSYAFMMYLGLVFGIIASNYVTNTTNLESERIFLAQIVLTIPALAGARLLYVVLHWDIYRHEPDRIWRRSEGGSAMQGGLYLSMAFSLPFLRVIGVPLGAFWDVTTFMLLIGQIFGRIGCALHGCCCGRPSNGPLSICLPDHNGVWKQRIPTQFLEVGLVSALLLVAAWYWSHRPFDGAVFLVALGLYSTARFALQPLRAVQDRHNRMNVQQVLAAAATCLALSGFIAGTLGAF